MKVERIEAKAWHCGQLARRLRLEHRDVLDDMGVDAHRNLRMTFEASVFATTWKIDGEVAAMAGVVGSLASPEAEVWAIIADSVATAHPVTVSRETLRFLADLPGAWSALTATILEDDAGSLDFAHWLGFLTKTRSELRGRPTRIMVRLLAKRKAA